MAVGTLLSAVSCAGAAEAAISRPTPVSPGRGTAVIPASPGPGNPGAEHPRPGLPRARARRPRRRHQQRHARPSTRPSPPATPPVAARSVSAPAPTWRPPSGCSATSGCGWRRAPPSRRLEEGYEPPEPNAFDQYQDFGHSHFRNSLIWGEDVTDVAIEGPGRIEGAGPARGQRPARAGQQADRHQGRPAAAVPQPRAGGRRPLLLPADRLPRT